MWMLLTSLVDIITTGAPLLEEPKEMAEESRRRRQGLLVDISAAV
jgi:hypothetical protein